MITASSHGLSHDLDYASWQKGGVENAIADYVIAAWRPLRVSVSSRLTRSTTLPTAGAGTDAASRNRDGEAFDFERRVRRLVLAHSRGPQRDRPSRIEVLVGCENALAFAVTKNHTASFEKRLQASSMIRR
jgi:hypothetical protein